MACVTTTGPIQKHLDTATTTVAVYFLTGWMPAVGLDLIKGVLRIRNVTGNFQAQPCYQLAAVRTDKPEAPVLLGSLAGAGENCSGESDISADTIDMMYIRFGVGYALSSGSTLGGGDVTLDASMLACGRIVGTFTNTFPVMSSAGSVVYPIAGFLSALEVSAWKIGVIVSGLTGNAQWRFTSRTATTSKEAPNAWSTTESYRNTDNVEVNTGEITMSIGSHMYVQPGIEVILSSGSTPAQVTLTVTVGVRRA